MVHFIFISGGGRWRGLPPTLFYNDPVTVGAVRSVSFLLAENNSVMTVRLS